MGAGVLAQKHGVGILLNKIWKRKIIQTNYVSERMITSTIKCDHRKIELTSVYFHHSGNADCNNKKHIQQTSTLSLGLRWTLTEIALENTNNGTIQQERFSKRAHLRVLAIKNLFDALVTPTLTYGAGTWATTKNTKKTSRTTQRRMLRLIRQTKKKIHE